MSPGSLNVLRVFFAIAERYCGDEDMKESLGKVARRIILNVSFFTVFVEGSWVRDSLNIRGIVFWGC